MRFFIKEHFGSVGTEQADAKSLNSLVSFVDVEAEKILVKGLKEVLPEASFITEEKTTLQSQLTGLQWIIDPLDGTTNFLRGVPAYSTSVALVLDGQPIIGVVIDIHQGDVYTALKGGGAFKNDVPLSVTNTKTFDKAMIATGFPYETYSPDHPMFSMLIEVIREARGLRRLGSAAIDLVYTACGVFDGYYEARLNAWDIAAGMLIVEEAGGTISSFDRQKNPLLSGSIVAGNAYIYSELTRRLEKHHAHNPFKLSVFILLLVSEASGQHFISLGYQHGYNVPAYERSPETNRTSPFFHLTYGKKTHESGGVLDQYYGGPDVHYHLFYQNLGNDDVMGSALGFVPELKFRLRKGKRSAWFGGGGLGVAWVSQPYDKNDNPTNQALGTPWNIYAQAGIEYQYQIDSTWYFGAELSVHHLSNSFFSFPNLGVNIPSLGVKIVKELRRHEARSKPAFSPKIYKTPWRPFLRFVYGITERAFDGPKFAVVGGGLGMRKRIAPHRTVLLGGEFMFDESSYYFVSRASGGDEEKARRQARRMLLFAGHEYHFGYASFLTEAGIYISEQFNRQSIISAKAGFNFYPFHQYFHYKHQFSVGMYIRAYFLRADFFEINVNYRL